MSELDLIKERKEKLFGFLKNYKEEIGFILLIVLMIVSYNVRTSNLNSLKDVTTGDYIPGDPDAAEFLRYAKYILVHGSLMMKDLMRYYPLGYNNLDEFNFLSHFIVYLYKFLHLFNQNITLNYVDVIFPAITFPIALIPFYFLTKKLFNYKVALVSSAFLAFMPPFLYRTVSGVGDKEALAIVFFFCSLYFYVNSIKIENKFSYLNAFLSGISTAVLGITWGGVNFIFLILGTTTIIKVALNNFNKRNFYSYVIWWFTTFILLNKFYPNYYGYQSIVVALTSQITLIALISAAIYYFVNELNVYNIKQKLNLNKYPIGVLSLGVTVVLGIIFILIFQGPGFISDRILNTFIDLTRPFSRNRWALTVAESQQPFTNSWFSDFGTYFMYSLLISSIVLFYDCFKNLKGDKNKILVYISISSIILAVLLAYKEALYFPLVLSLGSIGLLVLGKKEVRLTAIYTLFILSFIFSRYSSDSILNGKSTFSLILYIGSMVIFSLVILGYYIYGFVKDKELYKEFTEIDNTHIVVLVWFLVTAVGARSAIRLVFVFVPVTTVLVAYLWMKIFDYGISTNDKLKKIGSLALVTILLFAPFVSGSLVERGKAVINTAKSIGPSFDQQWQNGMKWVRENTPKDSVFAHWWDYGYWIQSFGERATLSDGGNARGAINFFIGRHLLTGRTNVEALELLKTHNATHVLIVSDEIGKYTAFSSIGADENYDRYSYIPTFFINPADIQEGRDPDGKETTSYLYKGTFVLDEDFIYNGKLFPKGASAVGGVIVTTRKANQNDTNMEMAQPKAIMFYQNAREDVPLSCLYLNGQEFLFDNTNNYNGCLRIIPVVNDDNTVNQIQGGLFLSPNTKNTLFSNLYLFDRNGLNDKNWEGFEKVYDDTDKGYTLAYYIRYGRMIGPMKIWKLIYSDKIKVNPDYLKTEVPNPDIEKVRDY